MKGKGENRLFAIDSRQQHGFTLIELLVAITIISILAALLLPALKIARSKAKYARSLSIRQSIRIDPDAVLYYTFDDMELRNIDSEFRWYVANLAGSGSIVTEYNPERVDGWTPTGITDNRVVYDAQAGRFTGDGALVCGTGAWTSVNLHNSLVGPPRLLDTSRDLTMVAWVKFTGQPTSGNGNIIIARGSGTIDGPTYQLRRNTSNKIEARFAMDSSNILTVTGATTIVDNIWCHVAATYTTDGTGTVYVNGNQDGTDTNTNVISISAGDLSWSSFWIGSNWAGYAAGLMVIDEVAVFHKALSSSEVNQYYQGSKP